MAGTENIRVDPLCCSWSHRSLGRNRWSPLWNKPNVSGSSSTLLPADYRWTTVLLHFSATNLTWVTDMFHYKLLPSEKTPPLFPLVSHNRLQSSNPYGVSQNDSASSQITTAQRCSSFSRELRDLTQVCGIARKTFRECALSIGWTARRHRPDLRARGYLQCWQEKREVRWRERGLNLLYLCISLDEGWERGKNESHLHSNLFC